MHCCKKTLILGIISRWGLSDFFGGGGLFVAGLCRYPLSYLVGIAFQLSSIKSHKDSISVISHVYLMVCGVSFYTGKRQAVRGGKKGLVIFGKDLRGALYGLFMAAFILRVSVPSREKKRWGWMS